MNKYCSVSTKGKTLIPTCVEIDPKEWYNASKDDQHKLISKAESVSIDKCSPDFLYRMKSKKFIKNDIPKDGIKCPKSGYEVYENNECHDTIGRKYPYIYKNGSSFSSLNEAKKACDSDSTCLGIWEQGNNFRPVKDCACALIDSSNNSFNLWKRDSWEKYNNFIKKEGLGKVKAILPNAAPYHSYFTDDPKKVCDPKNNSVSYCGDNKGPFPRGPIDTKRNTDKGSRCHVRYPKREESTKSMHTANAKVQGSTAKYDVTTKSFYINLARDHKVNGVYTFANKFVMNRPVFKNASGYELKIAVNKDLFNKYALEQGIWAIVDKEGTVKYKSDYGNYVMDKIPPLQSNKWQGVTNDTGYKRISIEGNDGLVRAGDYIFGKVGDDSKTCPKGYRAIDNDQWRKTSECQEAAKYFGGDFKDDWGDRSSTWRYGCNIEYGTKKILFRSPINYSLSLGGGSQLLCKKK